jgi:hypothetical protein
MREYLQFKILEAIYDTELGQNLIFMGGTAIHLVHGNTRFSEDLDFDNRALEKSDFDSLISTVKLSLSRMGYKLERRNVTGPLSDHISNFPTSFLDLLQIFHYFPQFPPADILEGQYHTQTMGLPVQ